MDPADVVIVRLLRLIGGRHGASFTVRLRSEPIRRRDGLVITDLCGFFERGRLSFTTTNWNADQTVTITGIADNLSDGDQSYAIRLLADNTTSDLGYKYVDPADVTLKNLDTEMGGYYVSSVSGDTDESGKTASFTVRK